MKLKEEQVTLPIFNHYDIRCISSRISNNKKCDNNDEWNVKNRRKVCEMYARKREKNMIVSR